MASSGQQKFPFLRERDERSIIVKIKFKLYEISTEVLLEVFSTCGNIETLENFKSGEEFHSRVCFVDKDLAIRALNWYNGRCIYGLLCKLELFQGFQVTDRLRKTEISTQETKEVPIGDEGAQFNQNSPRCFDQKFEEFSEIVLGDSKLEWSEIHEFSVEAGDEKAVDLAGTEGIANSITDVRPEISFNPSKLDAPRKDDDEPSAPETEESEAPMSEENRIEEPITDRQQESKSSLNSPETSPWLLSRAGVVLGAVLSNYLEVPNPTKKFELSCLEINKSIEEPHTQQNHSQVNFEPSEFIISGNANQELSKLVKLLIELMEIGVTNSKEVIWTDVRLKSIDCVTNAHKMFVKMPIRKFRVVIRVVVEDCCSYLHRIGSKASITYPFDIGRSSIDLDVLIEKSFSLIFNPGGVCLRDTCQRMDKAILVFDPGGSVIQGRQVMEQFYKWEAMQSATVIEIGKGIFAFIKSAYKLLLS